jgi:hypothetical protein
MLLRGPFGVHDQELKMLVVSGPVTRREKAICLLPSPFSLLFFSLF